MPRGSDLPVLQSDKNGANRFISVSFSVFNPFESSCLESRLRNHAFEKTNSATGGGWGIPLNSLPYVREI